MLSSSAVWPSLSFGSVSGGLRDVGTTVCNFTVRRHYLVHVAAYASLFFRPSASVLNLLG